MALKRAMWWVVAGGVLLSTSTAQAQNQVWLQDERFSSGAGVQRDRLRYTGGVAGVIGYDSNPLLRAGTENEPRVDTFRLTISPFFNVETRNPPGATKAPYSLSANAALSYYEFFNGPTKSPTQVEDLSGHRNFGFNGGIKLRIAPGARWGGDIGASLTRSIQPSNEGDPTVTFNRSTPSVSAGLSWTPGGGLFSWRLLGYNLVYNYFESDFLQKYNNFNHNFLTEATWRFLPRTSLFASSQLSLIRYSDATSEQPDGDAVTTRAGVNGLLTERFGFLVSAGWATTMFDSKNGSAKQDFDSLIAQAEARFYLSSPPKANDGEMTTYPTQLTIGYMRDWTQSYIGNFYNRDRGYASLAYFLSTRLRSTLQMSAAYLSFPDSYFADGAQRDTAFASVSLNGTAFLEYLASQHFGIFLSADYSSQLTDKKLRTDRINPNFTDDLSFSRVGLSLGARYLL